jgi:alpha-D-xyloside xylohydrolase
MKPGKVDLSASATGSVIEVKSSSLSVKIDTKTGKVSFQDLKGANLLSEKDYGVQFVPMVFTSRSAVTAALEAGA